MYRKIKFLIQQIRTIRKINKLEFKDTYTESVYHNGLIFHGHTAPQYLKRLHFLLKDKTISKEKMQIMFDVVHKYHPETGVMPGNVVLEIGAYIGYYVMKASDKAKKIFAIEAEPENFAKLQRNVDANYLTNIIPLHFAAWNKSGHIHMNVAGGQENSVTDSIKGRVVKVKCRKIDNVIKEKVDFVRIQVNGSELQVLQGMEKLLIKYQPRIEIQVLFNDKEPIIGYLKQLGYEIIIQINDNLHG